MGKTKVLIIEDDEFVANQMRWALADSHEVFLAEDRQAGLEILRQEHPALVTLDLGLPPHSNETIEGLLALGEMLQLDPLLKVVVISGQGEETNAISAVGKGAFDFFIKPVDIGELKVVLGRALYLRDLDMRRKELVRNPNGNSLEGMIGSSPQMLKVFDLIRKVAPSNAPVLLTGESGTGKEMAARAIHNLSNRKGKPFIPINCGAIPENLMESELFGHEKGSFTGAHVQRQGRIEAANGGTLFLDEVGELLPSLQVKLLRFLQEGEIERVGGRIPIQVDARVISATNMDLRKAMAEGRFREDLYFRIGVVGIPMPTLRERAGEVGILSQLLLERLGAELGKELQLSEQALASIESHPWPGNVRELENRLRRAVIMAEGSRISPEDLELSLAAGSAESVGLAKARAAFEKEMVEKALTRNRGNLTRCAEELKISRPTLYEMIEKLGIIRK